MLSYPITQDVHDARRRFPEIDRAVNIPYSDRSELEIVRVLGNTHYEHLEQLLILLNKHWTADAQRKLNTYHRQAL